MIAVRVQLTNPGQFFACCGLLELADRLWSGAQAWFTADEFRISSTAGPEGDGLTGLLRAIAAAPLRQLDLDDETSSPMELAIGTGLRLDWWREGASGCKELKTWAGRMNGVRIAKAMQAELGRTELDPEILFDYGKVVFDPSAPDKKVEPFYFDARRGSSAHPIDIGFAPDPLQMTSAAFPAVEFLCLAGVQRFRPKAGGRPRVFEYFTWHNPLTPAVARAAVCGLLREGAGEGFQFENAFRTDQRKHKGFTSATRI